MNSSERRMKLILLLQSKKNFKVNDIAEYFDVSRRTVFRDLRTLDELNVPVTWDKYHGYGIMRGYTIPPMMFTSKQLATIMMGLSFVKSQIDETLVDDAQNVELKINSVLPGELKDFMSNLDDKTITDPYYINKSSKKRGGDWFTIYSAIAQKKSIQFNYRDKIKDKKTSRTIDPLLMVYYTDHWNVVGHCHLRKAPRNFVLNRMNEITISDEPLLTNDNYSTEDLLFHSSEKDYNINILIHKSIKESFLGSLPAKIIKMEDADKDHLRISFHFDNLDYLNEWLLRFTTNASILSPEELSHKRVVLLNNMLNN